VTFVREKETNGPVIPPIQGEGFEFLDGIQLGDLLNAEFEATEASLAAASRPSVRIEVEEIDQGNMGRLVVCMEAACIMVAELQGINPFNQPGVEWGKAATKSILSGESTDRPIELDGKVSLQGSE
jgi:glucose-6-phosphate isomerase